MHSLLLLYFKFIFKLQRGRIKKNEYIIQGEREHLYLPDTFQESKYWSCVPAHVVHPPFPAKFFLLPSRWRSYPSFSRIYRILDIERIRVQIQRTCNGMMKNTGCPNITEKTMKFYFKGTWNDIDKELRSIYSVAERQFAISVAELIKKSCFIFASRWIWVRNGIRQFT